MEVSRRALEDSYPTATEFKILKSPALAKQVPYEVFLDRPNKYILVVILRVRGGVSQIKSLF